MKWSELRSQNTYEQIAEKSELTRQHLWLMEHRQGFSRDAMRKLKKAYPLLDLSDLIFNYPAE